MAKKPMVAPFAVSNWPAAQVEMWPLARIKPYQRNARSHPDSQIEMLANLMKTHGVDQPIVVDDKGIILKGHGRLKAAQMAGFEQFPVVVHRDISADEKKAIRVADNQSALLSSWNNDLLALELRDLQRTGFNLDSLGFDSADLARLLDSNSGETDPEVAPEPKANPTIRRGELWILGKHRILCGDSTKAEDAATLMGRSKAVLMNTDPPYGINYGDIANSRSRPANVRKGGQGKNYSTHDDKKIKNDDLDGAALQGFLERVIRTALPHLIEKPAFYLWHPMLTQGTFFAAAAAADILIHRQIIWVKPSLIMGRGHYHWRHELCFYGWIRGKRCAWYGGYAQDTIWAINRENDKIHPTQKPTELFKRPIENNSKGGEIVYEPFSGSGSQIIAAEMTGRRCFAIELDPSYVQVAVERWEAFTGKKAKRSDGATLKQLQDGIDEASNSRKPISRPNAGGDGKKRAVRKGRDARQLASRREPAGESPALAGDT